MPDPMPRADGLRTVGVPPITDHFAASRHPDCASCDKIALALRAALAASDTGHRHRVVATGMGYDTPGTCAECDLYRGADDAAPDPTDKPCPWCNRPAPHVQAEHFGPASLIGPDEQPSPRPSPDPTKEKS